MPRAGVLVVTLAGLIFPGAGAAHFQSGGYSHRDADCASRVDPITVVFYEWGWPDRVRNHLNHHGGWEGGDGGGQFFASHGNCGSAQGHSESGCVVCTRYHIRLRKTEHAADDVGARIGDCTAQRRDTCRILISSTSDERAAAGAKGRTSTARLWVSSAGRPRRPQ